VNYLGGSDKYSVPQNLSLDGVEHNTAGTRCYPLPENLSGDVQVSSSLFDKRMPDNRLYQRPPLNYYEIEDKLGTAKKCYFAYPFINFGD